MFRNQLFLFLLAPLLALSLRAQALVTDDPRNSLLAANSIVAVHSALYGTGTLFLYDLQPVILTSSHLLQGNTTATITLDHQTGVSKALFDSPADDIALLSVPDTFDAQTVLSLKKRTAGAICSKETMQDGRCFLAAFRSSSGYTDDHVDFAEGGKSRAVALISPWTASSDLDFFVSGSYQNILSLPIYLRPGSSGGAYYHNGVFAGLVTEVSASGEALAYAIPIEGIESVIYNGPSRRAKWVRSGSGYHLQTQVDSKIVEMTAGAQAFDGERYRLN